MEAPTCFLCASTPVCFCLIKSDSQLACLDRANVHRYVMGGYMSYDHLATTPILDWQTIYDMAREWEETEDKSDDGIAEFLRRHPGFNGACLTGRVPIAF